MATLIKIGNSQGIRIPKPLVEQAQLENRELSLEVTQEGLLIKPIKATATRLAGKKFDCLLKRMGSRRS